MLYSGGGETERIFCCPPLGGTPPLPFGKQVLGNTNALGRFVVRDNGNAEGRELLPDIPPPPFIEAKVAATAKAVLWAIGGVA